jgi:DNA-binding MarR family transcriptional regulator
VDRYTAFHEILVTLFHEVIDIEHKAIISGSFKDITTNDMHVIEAIGTGEPKNMSSIAKTLSVTVGTLTIAMNNLVKKGYVIRKRSEEDRRVVFISLSEKGRQAFIAHKKFHENLIQSTIEGLSEEEIQVLVKAFSNMNKFFKSF